MPVYAYPTCSDRHIRTFFSGFGGADNLLWLTREWQVVGCTYPSSAFKKGKSSDIFQGIRASATVPFLSEPVEIDGKKYLDGGIACKIPVEWALQEGYEKIIVIKTQDSSYRKTSNMPEGLIRSFYHSYPRLMGTC